VIYLPTNASASESDLVRRQSLVRKLVWLVTAAVTAGMAVSALLATWQEVERLLRQQWSPEQIAGRLKLEQQATVSHECIYLYVYAEKRRGGTLHQHLRSQKKQRKRYSGYIRRGQIRNRTSIDKRPQIVANKGRFGDWEADTIVGARHKGGMDLPLQPGHDGITQEEKDSAGYSPVEIDGH